MKYEVIRGISMSRVQCWTCRNAPILDKENTLGAVSDEIRARLESTGIKHEQRHPSHRVTLTLYIQDLPKEETKSELPIVRDMRDRFKAQSS